MKTKLKRVLSLVLSLSLMVSLAACGKKVDGSSGATQNEDENAPIELVDQAGRKLTLEEPAETLVSSYYITTYATVALGLEDRVIGLEKKPEKRPIYKLAAPELLDKPNVGSMKEFNLEAAAALEPDLILMPIKLQDKAETLTELGLDVLVVDPEDQDRLEEMLTLIAKACGVEENAEKLIAYYDEQEKRLDKLTDGREEPSVYLCGNSDYLTVATDEMYQSHLIDMAGGENAAADIEGDYWTQVSYESLLAMDPDYIILPAGASYSVDEVKNDQQLMDVAAVKNGSVYQMPTGIEEWDSPIPSGMLGAMWMASLMHSEVYSFEEFVADAQAFYQDFYGFDLDPALVTR